MKWKKREKKESRNSSWKFECGILFWKLFEFCSGIGRRSGPSHFLLAVAQAPDTPNTYPTKFLSLCRVGTGYTMTELQDINQKLDKHWKPWTDKSSPGFLQQASGEPKADLWVDPPHSFIVRVQAAQLLESDSFAAGCTLRFPRVREVRHDKNWYQLVVRSIDWLNACLHSSLIDWLNACLHSPLIGWLIGWLMQCIWFQCTLLR